MKISYAITICNELDEIKVLLAELLGKVDPEDEVVVMFDEENGDPKVWEYLNSVAVTNDNLVRGFELHSSRFFNHFANWKNYLNSLCTGDYIFNIDADEIPNDYLLENLKSIIKANPENDVFYVPRINKVEGITQEHVKKWNWIINEKGWINFPDYQMRIYKNKETIRWVGKVHEHIEGFSKYATLPQEEVYSLKHYKTIEKQEKQNNYYNLL